jgi:hypothetical protein
MSKRVKDICIEIAAWIGAACFYGGIAFLLYGCKSIEYVPVETVRTERVTVHDSVYIENTIHDSVTIHTKGDTVFIEHWSDRWRDRWRDRWHDSIRVDSIQVPYPVERKLTKWETFCLDYGKVMTGCTIVLFVTFIFLVIRWFTGRKRST